MTQETADLAYVRPDHLARAVALKQDDLDLCGREALKLVDILTTLADPATVAVLVANTKTLRRHWQSRFLTFHPVRGTPEIKPEGLDVPQLGILLHDLERLELPAALLDLFKVAAKVRTSLERRAAKLDTGDATS